MLLPWLALIAVALVVMWVSLLSVSRARRLDRLHIRTDAARVGLQAALDRRSRVAAEIAAALPAVGRDATALRSAVAEARGGAVSDRESAENTLTRALSEIDRSAVAEALGRELADAEQLVIVARRVYNDAVRDTLDLRSRRLVAWLRLAGTAPLPRYFDIADPEPIPATVRRSVA
ncbi:NUDIX hydrolase [Pseudonocardia hispaniensis]|uniref:NUDIX hydrolase n=1 Tax=Pseudonocardia hispaniensis TaxID=904933 RepID=A0ABW1IZU0_9PSEU